MRYRVWLDATPEGAQSSRRKSLTYRGEGPPDLEVPFAFEYLLGYLFEAGPTSGQEALAWGELESWQRQTGIALNEFEVTALRQLSMAYLGMTHAARDKDCPDPTKDPDEQPRPQRRDEEDDDAPIPVPKHKKLGSRKR